MPLPMQRRDQNAATKADHTRPFGDAHGDVAALHAEIESRFAAPSPLLPPDTVLAQRVEAGVQALSRGAGIVGLAAALAGIAWLIA